MHSACPPSEANKIVCVDSATCGNDRETVNIPVSTGVPVYIAVLSNPVFGERRGDFVLDISCTPQ